MLIQKSLIRENLETGKPFIRENLETGNYFPIETQQALFPRDSGNLPLKGRIFDWVVWDTFWLVIVDCRAISARFRGIVESFFTTCGNSSILQ
jgi:hypothetical protein